MFKYAILMAAGVSLSIPAAAQTAVQAPAQAAPIVVQNTKSEVNRVVCKKQEEIGSRLGAKKVCMTVKQWQDQADANREDVERIQQNTGTRPSGI